MDPFWSQLLIEVVKGVVAIAAGLTAGLAVAGYTSARNAALERDKWTKDQDRQREEWENARQLERDRLTAEDDRRWLFEKRRIYAAFMADILDADERIAEFDAAVEMEVNRLADPRDRPPLPTGSAIARSGAEVELLAESRTAAAARSVSISWAGMRIARMGIIGRPATAPADDPEVKEAAQEWAAAKVDFLQEARKELGLDQYLVRLDELRDADSLRSINRFFEVPAAPAGDGGVTADKPAR
jgi:hypothetical protein